MKKFTLPDEVFETEIPEGPVRVVLRHTGTHLDRSVRRLVQKLTLLPATEGKLRSCSLSGGERILSGPTVSVFLDEPDLYEVYRCMAIGSLVVLVGSKARVDLEEGTYLNFSTETIFDEIENETWEPVRTKTVGEARKFVEQFRISEKTTTKKS